MSELGRLAYEAYYRNIGPLGGPLTFWPELDEQVRSAWDAAADAAAAGPDPVHEPERGGF